MSIGTSRDSLAPAGSTVVTVRDRFVLLLLLMMMMMTTVMMMMMMLLMMMMMMMIAGARPLRLTQRLRPRPRVHGLQP